MTPRETDDDSDLVTLPPIDDGADLIEHPEGLTDDEVRAGLDLYEAVDDLDDYSTGLPEDPAGQAAIGPVTATYGYGLAVERAQRIRAIMLAFGVPEVSIEIQAGRPSGGDIYNSLNPVSVISHHIASMPSASNPTPGLSLVKRGRSDLPGPLANGTAGMDLVYRILTLGWANHPGYGGPWTVRSPLGSFTIPKDNARPYAWGTEYEGGYTNAVWDATYTNKRTGARMTYREFMGRCNAALTYAIWQEGISSRGKARLITPGLDLSGCHGEHKSWAPSRKPDRKDYSTESGRNELRPFYTRTIYKQQEDDDVSAQDVWDHQIPIYDGDKGETKAARVVLSQTHNRAENARRVSRANAAETKALRSIIRGMALDLGGPRGAEAIATLDALPETDDLAESPDGEG